MARMLYTDFFILIYLHCMVSIDKGLIKLYRFYCFLLSLYMPAVAISIIDVYSLIKRTLCCLPIRGLMNKIISKLDFYASAKVIIYSVLDSISNSICNCGCC